MLVIMLLLFWLLCVFFFFKQKTAYEMRISDWSSDVCSSDLETSPVSTQTLPDDPLEARIETVGRVMPHLEVKIVDEAGRTVARGEIGRASCRERVCQYV